MKTCEEYVVTELQKTKEELALAKLTIEELQKHSVQESKSTTSDDKYEKEVVLIKQPNVYFFVDVVDHYNLSHLLVENNYTDNTILQEALDNDEKLLEVSNLKYLYYGSTKKAISIEKSYYDVLYKYSDTKVAIIGQYNDGTFWIHQLNDTVGLNYKELEATALQKLRTEITKYYQYKYNDDFENVLNKYNEKRDNNK